MSQTDAQEKTIDGHTFKVFKLAPLDAQDVLIDIGHALAPALGKAATAFDNLKGQSIEDLDVDDPRVSTAISTLIQGITKEKMRGLVGTMASVTHCNGTPLPRVQEQVFRGDLPLLYQWLWFALVTNFGNFTSWVGTGISVVSKTKPADPSPST